MAADTTKPQVLVLGPPTFFSDLESKYSQDFHLLHPFSLPLPQFFAADRIQPSSIRALICVGGYPVTAEVLRHLPSLGLVMTTSAGLNHIDLQECHRRGVQVAGAGSLFSEDVADIAVGLLIDVTRKISAADRFVRRRQWPESLGFPLGSKVCMHPINFFTC